MYFVNPGFKEGAQVVTWGSCRLVKRQTGKEEKTWLRAFNVVFIGSERERQGE
jgi:hypothetical protein